jgi:hypothetical protein
VAEEKKTITLGDRTISVTALEVVERSGETLAEYLLEDGSTIRVQNVAAIVYRMDGMFDPEGNPIYIVKLGTSVTTIKAPKFNKFTQKSNGS